MLADSKKLGRGKLTDRPAVPRLGSNTRSWGRRSRFGSFWAGLSLTATVLSVGSVAAAQTANVQAPRESFLFLRSKSTADTGPTSSDTPAPVTLTFQDALERARKYSPQFQAAATAANLAHEDRLQARAAMLPSANYTTQYLGTQGNGKIPTGRYVTNDGVHVYRAWGVFRQELSADTLTLASYHHAEAADVLARTQEEIAQRGLTVTVTQAYYGLVVAERKYATSQQSRDQAQLSLQTSQQMEQQGQVAHSDVITFQIQYNQQEQAFTEAKLAMDNARLSLAVLLFPNFDQDFNVVDDLDTAQPLPPLPEVQRMARENNPQIRAATAILRGANSDLSTARTAFLPSLSFDVDYGIEANRFALRSPAAEYPEVGRVPNLGYFATVSLNLPVWDWGTLRSKLRQAEYRDHQAHEDLSFAQRQMLSNLAAYYNEALTARTEVSTLRSSADLAAESLRLNTLRYKAGQATVLDVLNAQTTLTQARDAYADGMARARVALANLQTLTGSF
jgi:outer membrane protein TolC